MSVTDIKEVSVDCKRRRFLDDNGVSLVEGTSLPEEQASLFEEKAPKFSGHNQVEKEEVGNGNHCCLFRFCRLHFGVFLAFISCFFQAMSAICIKMLAGRIYPSEAGACRLVFYFIFASLCLIYYKVPVRLSRKQAFWLLMRTIAGTTGLCLSFYGYQNIPVGDATAILLTSPVFVGFLAWMLLGEKFTLFDALLAMISIVGIILIARPTFLFGNLLASAPEGGNAKLGLVSSIIGAFVVAVVFVFQRKLGRLNVHPLIQVAVYGMGGFILTCVITTLLGVWEMPRCGRERIALLSASFLGFLSQVCVTNAFKLEKATYVALIKSNNVLFAFVLDFLIFGTVPFWLSVVGASLIVVSCVSLTLKKWISSSHKKAKEDLS